jgi:hypothetical protein
MSDPIVTTGRPFDDPRTEPALRRRQPAVDRLGMASPPEQRPRIASPRPSPMGRAGFPGSKRPSQAATWCRGWAAREDFSIQASRTAATSSRPSVRQRLLSRRAPRRRSRPDNISRAASAACDSSSPTPGWTSHQRACHAAAACSKQPGLRSRSPRQTSIPCSSEPRRTALGSGRHGFGVSSAVGARSAWEE